MKGISRLKDFRTLKYVSQIMEKNQQKSVNRIVLSPINNNVNQFHHIHCDARLENFFRIVRKSNDSQSDVISHSTLKDLLQKCESVPEQINVFQSYVKLTDEDIANRFLLCSKIENIFKTVLPHSSVHLVGSSATGLGRRGSDVDFTFQLLDNAQVLQNNSSTNLASSNDGDAVEITSSEFTSLSTKLQLLFLKEQLIKSDIGENFTIIPGRCPILNFMCNDLNCDLSISNWSASHATNLMQICEKLDCRVAPLFRLIVYWGKHSQIVGGVFKFKSYSIFLMLVYFLQTRQPPILPTVEDIFHKTELLSVDNCLYDTSQCIRKFPKSKNSDSLESLLREFFFFYGNFNFSSVICVLKANLCDGQALLSQQPNFKINTISIQDPFNLSWNVTTGVGWKYNKHFIKALLSTCETYHESPHKPNSGENWGLVAVLDASFQNSSFVSKDYVEIEILLKNVLNSVDDIDKCWNIAAENIFTLLRCGLIFQCTKLESNSDATQFSKRDSANNLNFEYSNKNYKNSYNTESTAENNVKYIYISSAMCTAADTWLGRNNYVQNVYVDEVTFLDNEQEVSRRILKDKSAEDKKEFRFICECIGVYRNSDKYLILNLKPVNRNTFLPKLGIVLKEYILKYALRYL